MNHDHYEPNYIRSILRDVKTIALVGASANPARPSHGVMNYLLSKGYNVIPVNPGLAGQELLGQTVYATLSDIPVSFDMIDIFRNSDSVLSLVIEVLELPQKPKVIWMQLGVSNDEATQLAEAEGLRVVVNRCPKIEYEILIG